ncbi:hypothetical protein Aru02nite_45540 [Actinocatenispora rupis]|uniref:Uncharacterized protein n=1 Tax=Actinocatenispora rupis TaxID=519421 RepID=A0A8J3J303_9ACTN|nr:hypothetical protein Aru02nite_45540 [Actinocatenispora rupis]
MSPWFHVPLGKPDRSGLKHGATAPIPAPYRHDRAPRPSARTRNDRETLAAARSPKDSGR